MSHECDDSNENTNTVDPYPHPLGSSRRFHRGLRGLRGSGTSNLLSTCSAMSVDCSSLRGSRPRLLARCILSAHSYSRGRKARSSSSGNVSSTLGAALTDPAQVVPARGAQPIRMASCRAPVTTQPSDGRDRRSGKGEQDRPCRCSPVITEDHRLSIGVALFPALQENQADYATAEVAGRGK